MIYDPLETEASRRILLELLDELGFSPDFGLVGGWAVHSLIGENFLRATGREFLRSRDIDVFINCKGDFPRMFSGAIRRIGFVPREYRFRYTLILDRDSMKKLSGEEARGRPIFSLIYVFLDVLGNRESGEVGVWPNEIVARILSRGATRPLVMDGRKVLVPTEDFLFLLKVDSFLKRETREKRMKDACDLYGLLFYSPIRILELLRKERWKAKMASQGLEALLEEDAPEFIGEALFGDRFKSGLVRRNLLRQLEALKSGRETPE